ncbi:unnamed protein product, partial [Linum tenue]
MDGGSALVLFVAAIGTLVGVAHSLFPLADVR